MSLGYHRSRASTGSEGFLAAAESADVELILVSYDLFYGGWKLTDTLANLQADARTAAVPLYVYGPYDIRIMRPNLERDFPGIRFLVPPTDAAMLERQLKGRPSVLTAAERTRLRPRGGRAPGPDRRRSGSPLAMTCAASSRR